jgi:hypothetical protein
MPAAEEIEKMLEFLSQLDSLKTRDPQAYLETIQALGLPMPAPPAAASSRSDSNNEAGNDAANDPLATLYKSIKDFQIGNTGNEKVKVAMPDGKTILGKEGVENKVSLSSS